MTSQQALFNAVQLHRSGRFAEADAAYRQILASAGDHFETLNFFAQLCADTGRIAEAAELLKKATQLRPDSLEAHNQLGSIYCGLGRFRDAEAAFQQALRISPHNAGVQNNLATILANTDRLDQALATLQEAAAANPGSSQILTNLGNVLSLLGRYDEALDVFQKALQIQPGAPEVLLNLAVAHHQKGEFDAAVDGFRQLLQAHPNHLEARKSHGNTLRLIDNLDESIACYEQVLAANPGNWSVASARLFSLQYHEKYDAHQILAENRIWADRFARPISENVPPHTNDPSPDRRVRIGYVSPDFRSHCLTLFTEPLFIHHDRQQFEIFCYSMVAKPDQISERLQTRADAWRKCRDVPEPNLAEQIRADGIDILIDLTRHMPAAHPLLFAFKPAPVQVTHLAYPGTTGIAAIDYRFTDPLPRPTRPERRPLRRTIFPSPQNLLVL
jgi:predicted O-linked N-acetylglucosamine transferase (SPINDLY family)